MSTYKKKNIMRYYILVLFSFLVGVNAISANIEKGYQALSIYNYFEAKRIFSKSLKKDSASCAFGLATIHFRNDNPFHSIDSAFHYIQVAERNFHQTDEKLRKKLVIYGYENIEVIRLRDSITAFYFKIALEENSIASFNHFIEQHPWAKEMNRAIYKRDALMYDYLKSKNKASLYKDFLDSNSESYFYKFVYNDYELALYKEHTINGTVEEFEQFINQYPTNSHVKDAEDRIYEITVQHNKTEDYDRFIKTYPNNHNMNDAWRKLHQLFMVKYSEDRAEVFKATYPEYPFKEELNKEIIYAKRELVPMLKDGLFGGLNYNGEMIIPAVYQSMSFFKEGLAVVEKNGRFGYVDKGNKLVIPYNFDEALSFENGSAIVGIDDKYGVIDRNGKHILPVIYDEIGVFQEGLIYALKDSLYGYYDKKGRLKINHCFEEAFSFQNGKAKVQVDGMQAYINNLGDYIFPPLYKNIKFYTDSLVVFELNGKFGISNLSGQWIDSTLFDMIGELNEGLAIVSLDQKIGYLDVEGKVKIAVEFDEFPNFIELGKFNASTAVAYKNGKYGVINKTGGQILPFKYHQLGFISNQTAFNKGKGWGYFNLNYEISIQPNFEFAESFIDSFAMVQKDGKWGVIDTTGNYLLNPIYDEVELVENLGFITILNDKKGLFDWRGEELLAIENEQVRKLKEGLVLVVNSDEISYYYPKEKCLLKLEDNDE